VTPVGAALAARFPSRFPAWHRKVYRLTRGIIGHRWTGYPCLLLTTTGRKSGQPRDTVLTYVTVDGVPTVAGSNGGSDTPPAWLLNLRSDPDAEVLVGRRRFRVAAAEVDPGSAAFAEGWRSLNQLRGGRYEGYQAATDRPIPLVQLLKRSAAARGTVRR
jgi:F420H(2)-dependent quinone reductase